VGTSARASAEQKTRPGQNTVRRGFPAVCQKKEKNREKMKKTSRIRGEGIGWTLGKADTRREKARPPLRKDCEPSGNRSVPRRSQNQGEARDRSGGSFKQKMKSLEKRRTEERHSSRSGFHLRGYVGRENLAHVTRGREGGPMDSKRFRRKGHFSSKRQKERMAVSEEKSLCKEGSLEKEKKTCDVGARCV